MMSWRIFVATIAAALALSSTAFAQSNGRYVRGAGETVGPFGAGTVTGDVGFEPYSGSYLPRSEGPLAKERDEEVRRQIVDGFNGGECDLVHKIIKDNAKLDTAAKFDRAVDNANGTRPLSAWERFLASLGIGGRRNGKSDLRDRYLKEGHDPSAESWEGFCHNWAPAGLDPVVNFTVSMDKIYADVPFGIGDMRELATWAYPSSSTLAWFGKRHNDKNNPERPQDELDPVDVMTILENYVGPGKPGIVFDVDPGYMVWNQPFYKWSRTSTEVASGGPRSAPAGGKIYKVAIDATYGLEGSYGHRGGTIDRTVTWNAYVYTDAAGNIVDSAWDGYNKVPDFAWINKPREGDKDFENLKKIAREGISVKDIESFCNKMKGLPNGPISAEDAAEIGALLDKICPVLDQNAVNDYIRATAARIGMDYNALDGLIRSTTAAHS